MVPHFANRAFITYRYLPFSVNNQTGNPLPLVHVSIGSPCAAMIDPFRPHVFHAVCTQAGSFLAVATVRGDGETLTEVQVPIQQVRHVRLNEATAPVDVEWEQGRQLFFQSRAGLKACNECHGVPTAIRVTQNADSLAQKFKSSASADMKLYDNLFTPSEQAALAKFINKEFFK